MAKIDNLIKLVERKNPFLNELVDALCNSEWVYKKTVDQFNKEGDELSFDSLESDTGDDSSYLSGRSSNPKVGRDQWQVNWVVEQILKGTLDVSPQTSENPDEIKEIKDEINAIYSDYVDFDDDEDDEYEDDDYDESIEAKRKSLNNQLPEAKKEYRAYDMDFEFDDYTEKELIQLAKEELEYEEDTETKINNVKDAIKWLVKYRPFSRIFKIKESKAESLDNKDIVHDIYDILLGNNKNTLVDNIDNQEVNLDTSTITFDIYDKKIEITIKIKDIK